MLVHGLSPGMQNAEKADFDPETLGVSGHFQQCGSRSLKEKRKQELLVLPHQRDQLMRDADNNVEVFNGQQFLTPFPEPFLTCVDLALWAVSIPARMKFDLLMPAADALVAMTAQSRGAAANDGIEYLLLCPVPCVKKPGSDQADDIGNLTARRRHECTESGGGCCVSRSRGLTAARIRCWDRCT